MADATLPGLLLTGDHASRPAATTVGSGALYACSTHGLIYQSDASSWSTWATLGSAASGSITSSGYTQNTARLLGRTTASSGAIEEITVGSGLTLSAGALSASASGGGTPVLRLDYALASDISNQALTGGTAFDIIANQNFTVGSGSSLVEVACRGFGFCNDATGAGQYLLRVNIDSAGTPVIKPIGGAVNTDATANRRGNVLPPGVVYVSGLSAATHTIKAQILSISNDHFYCRASTNGPTTGPEFFEIQVIEHP